MNYRPFDDDEIKVFAVLPPGEYPFTVQDANETTSKSGNEMITMTLAIESGNQMAQVKFYLLEKMMKTFKHFHRATGMMDKFDDGMTTAYDCIDKTGIVRLKIEKGAAKDDGTFYPDKNVVDDFVWDTSKPAAELERKDPPVDDDDIPWDK